MQFTKFAHDASGVKHQTTKNTLTCLRDPVFSTPGVNRWKMTEASRSYSRSRSHAMTGQWRHQTLSAVIGNLVRELTDRLLRLLCRRAERRGSWHDHEHDQHGDCKLTVISCVELMTTRARCGGALPRGPSPVEPAYSAARLARRRHRISYSALASGGVR